MKCKKYEMANDIALSTNYAYLLRSTKAIVKDKESDKLLCELKGLISPCGISISTDERYIAIGDCTKNVVIVYDAERGHEIVTKLRLDSDQKSTIYISFCNNEFVVAKGDSIYTVSRNFGKVRKSYQMPGSFCCGISKGKDSLLVLMKMIGTGQTQAPVGVFFSNGIAQRVDFELPHKEKIQAIVSSIFLVKDNSVYLPTINEDYSTLGIWCVDINSGESRSLGRLKCDVLRLQSWSITPDGRLIVIRELLDKSMYRVSVFQSDNLECIISKEIKNVYRIKSDENAIYVMGSGSYVFPYHVINR